MKKIIALNACPHTGRNTAAFVREAANAHRPRTSKVVSAFSISILSTKHISSQQIGTIELCLRVSKDAFDNMGILRVDV